MKLVEYKSGETIRIVFMDCGQKKYDVDPFLEMLKSNGNSDYFQIISLLDRTVQHGVVWNDFKTKRLKGENAKPICEFKARGGTRLFWFFDEADNTLIVCTHAFF